MAFPIINYKYNDLEEAHALTDMVDKKLGLLEKYLDGDEAMTCDVEFEKVAPSQNGKIYRLEVNFMIDGTLYRAEATEESFEHAIDEVRDELDKELRRAKGKQEDLRKQMGRAAKEQTIESAQ
jgi:ribosomal subunit interface protein